MKQGSKTHKGRKKILGSYPYITVMLSITLALFVIGLFGLIIAHARQLSEQVHNDISINIELKKDLSDSVRNDFHRYLSAKTWLNKNEKDAVHYISEKDAMKDFVHTYGEDFNTVLDKNPLPSSYVVKIAPEYSDTSSLANIKDELTAQAAVSDVFYNEKMIHKVLSNVQTISIVLIAFAGILVLASILLIKNTIKLALYSQRFLIRSMQLVGATGWFIRRPFLWRAMFQGFVSGLLAAGMLYGILQYGYQEIPDLSGLRKDEYIYSILGALLIIGALLGFISAWRSVNRYLKMSLDELY